MTGVDDAEHLSILQRVLSGLDEWGSRLKQNKCTFMARSVQYLGHIVDADGLHTSPDKIKAIEQAPKHRNVQ